MSISDILNKAKSGIIEADSHDKKTIRIECDGSTTIDIDDLQPLQGNLKELTDVNYEKGKNSILENGFSFPIFMWVDSAGTRWIIDFHQRQRILRRMRDAEGYTIPKLPAVHIFAKDKKDAKKKILLQESKYGNITEEGLYDFMNEPGLELDATELLTEVTFPEFDMEYVTVESAGDEQEKPEKQAKQIECPACHEKFTPK